MAINDADKATDGQQHQHEQPNGQQQAGQVAAAPPSTASSSSLPPADQPSISMAAQRAGLAQALEELARGERAADKLERELRVFEAKLEELLSSMAMSEEDLEGASDNGKQAEGGETAGGQDTAESGGPASGDGKK